MHPESVWEQNFKPFNKNARPRAGREVRAANSTEVPLVALAAVASFVPSDAFAWPVVSRDWRNRMQERDIWLAVFAATVPLVKLGARIA